MIRKYNGIFGIENMYLQYHALGGNGVMDDIRQKFFALPLRKNRKRSDSL